MEYTIEKPGCSNKNDFNEQLTLWLNSAKLALKNNCHDHTFPSAIYKLVSDVQKHGLDLTNIVFTAQIDQLGKANGTKRSSFTKNKQPNKSNCLLVPKQQLHSLDGLLLI